MSVTAHFHTCSNNLGEVVLVPFLVVLPHVVLVLNAVVMCLAHVRLVSEVSGISL